VITDATIVTVITRGLFTILTVAAPPLVIGLAAGLIMSIFQTVTSIQEQTLAFIPKIVAVLGAIALFGPFMVGRLREYLEFMMTYLITHFAG